jgi:predicted amidophosphoribosyltransferase
MLELLAALDADSCDACEGVAGAGGVVSTRGIASRLCAACLGELPERPEPLVRLPEGATRGWRGAPYAGPLGALVRASKYGGRASLADAVAAHAGGLAARVVREVDVVVAVPSPRVRVWWRGVDLAGGVARAVGGAVGVPVARALVRRRWRAQAGLAHDAREANARGAFETRTGAEISGARVLLVDDVLTTGATAGACADALLQAGARRVDVFVAAAA